MRPSPSILRMGTQRRARGVLNQFRNIHTSPNKPTHSTTTATTTTTTTTTPTSSKITIPIENVTHLSSSKHVTNTTSPPNTIYTSPPLATHKKKSLSHNNNNNNNNNTIITTPTLNNKTHPTHKGLFPSILNNPLSSQTRTNTFISKYSKLPLYYRNLFTARTGMLGAIIIAGRQVLTGNTALTLWEEPKMLELAQHQTDQIAMEKSSQRNDPTLSLFDLDATHSIRDIDTSDDPDFDDFNQQKFADETQLTPVLRELNDFISKPKDTEFTRQSAFTESVTDDNLRRDLERNVQPVSEEDGERQVKILELLVSSGGRLTYEQAVTEVDAQIDRERKRRDPNYINQSDLEQKLKEQAVKLVSETNKPLLPSEISRLFSSQMDPWLRERNSDGQLIKPDGTGLRQRSVVIDEEDLSYDKRILRDIEKWFKVNSPNANTSKQLREYLLDTEIPKQWQNTKELAVYMMNQETWAEKRKSETEAQTKLREMVSLFLSSGIFEAYKLNVFSHHHPWSYYFVPAEPQDAFEPTLCDLDTFKEIDKKQPIDYTGQDIDLIRDAHYYFNRWMDLLREKPELLDMVEEVQLEQAIAENVKHQIASTKEVFEHYFEEAEDFNDLDMDKGVYNAFLTGVKGLVTTNQEVEEFKQIKSVDRYRQIRSEFQSAVLEFNSIAAVLEETKSRNDPETIKLLSMKRTIAHKRMKDLHHKFSTYMRFEAVRNGIDKNTIEKSIKMEMDSIINVAQERLKVQIYSGRTGDTSILDTLPMDFASPTASLSSITGEKSPVRLMMEDQIKEARRIEQQQEKFFQQLNEQQLAQHHNITARDGADVVAVMLDPAALPGLDFNSQAYKDAQARNKLSIGIQEEDPSLEFPTPSIDEYHGLRQSDGMSKKVGKDGNPLPSKRQGGSGNRSGSRGAVATDGSTASPNVQTTTVPGLEIQLQRVYNPNTNKYVYYADSDEERALFTEWTKTLDLKYQRMLELRQLHRAREHEKYRQEIEKEIDIIKAKQKAETDKQKAELTQQLMERGYNSDQINKIIEKTDFSVELPEQLRDLYQRYNSNDQFSIMIQDQTDPRVIAALALELQELEQLFTPLGKRTFQQFLEIAKKESSLDVDERGKIKPLKKSELDFLHTIRGYISKPVPETDSEQQIFAQNAHFVLPQHQYTIDVPPPPTIQFQWPALIEEFITSLTLDQGYNRLELEYSPFTFLSGFNHTNGREEFEAYATTGPAHPVDPRPVPTLPFSEPLNKYFSPQTAVTVFGLIHFGPFTQGDDIIAVPHLDDNINYTNNEITNYAFEPSTPPQPWDNIETRLDFFKQVHQIDLENENVIDLTKDISFDTDPFLDDDYLIELQNLTGDEYRPTQRERILAKADQKRIPVENMLTEALKNNKENIPQVVQDQQPQQQPQQGKEEQNQDAIGNNTNNNNNSNDDNNNNTLETQTLPTVPQQPNATRPVPNENGQIELDALQGLDEGMILSTLNQFARLTMCADNNIAQLTDSQFQMLTYNVIQSEETPFFCVTNLEYKKNSPINIHGQNEVFDNFPPKTTQVVDPTSISSIDSVLDAMWEGFQIGIEQRSIEEGLLNVEDAYNPPQKPVENPTAAVVSTWLFAGSLSTPVAKMTNYYTLDKFIDMPSDVQRRVDQLTMPKLYNYHNIKRYNENLQKFVVPFINQMFNPKYNRNNPNNEIDQDGLSKKQINAQIKKNRYAFEQEKIEQKWDRQSEIKKIIKRRHWPSQLSQDLKTDNPYFITHNSLQQLKEYAAERGLNQPLVIPVKNDGTTTNIVDNKNNNNNNNDTNDGSGHSTKMDNIPAEILAKHPHIAENQLLLLENGLQFNPLYINDPKLLEEKEQYDSFVTDVRVNAFMEREAKKWRLYRREFPRGYHWPELTTVINNNNQRDDRGPIYTELPLPKLIAKLLNNAPNAYENAINPKLNSAAHLVTHDALWVHRLQRYFQHEQKLDYYLGFVPVNERHTRPYRYGHLSQKDRSEMLLDDAQMLYNAVLLVTPDKSLFAPQSDLINKRRVINIYSQPDPLDSLLFNDVLQDYDPEAIENERLAKKHQLNEKQKSSHKHVQKYNEVVPSISSNDDTSSTGGWFSGVWGWLTGTQ